MGLPPIRLDNSGQKIDIDTDSIIVNFILWAFHDVEEQKASAGHKNLVNILDLDDFKYINPDIILKKELLGVFKKLKKVANEIGDMTFAELDKKIELKLPKVGKFEIFTLSPTTTRFKPKGLTTNKVFVANINGLETLTINKLTPTKINYIVEQGMWSKEGTDYREGKHKPRLHSKGDDVEGDDWVEENKERETNELPPITQQEIDGMINSGDFRSLIDLKITENKITFSDMELKKHHFKRLGIYHLKMKDPLKNSTGLRKVTVPDFWNTTQGESANSFFAALFARYVEEGTYNKLPIEYSKEIEEKYVIGKTIMFRKNKYVIQNVTKDSGERGEYLELILDYDVIRVNKNGKVLTKVATLDDKPVDVVDFGDDVMLDAINDISIIHNPNKAYKYTIYAGETEAQVKVDQEFIFTTDVSGSPRSRGKATNEDLKSPITRKVFQRGDEEDSTNKIAPSTYFTEEIMNSPTLLNQYKDEGNLFLTSLVNNYEELTQAIEDSLEEIEGGN
tara:strand:+ start:14 stop:1534 length:1521 start_codon:yes stop_codon:yes gene_type:complete